MCNFCGEVRITFKYWNSHCVCVGGGVHFRLFTSHRAVIETWGVGGRGRCKWAASARRHIFSYCFYTVFHLYTHSFNRCVIYSCHSVSKGDSTTNVYRAHTSLLAYYIGLLSTYTLAIILLNIHVVYSMI